MPRVVVSGGTGFIGGHVVDALVSAGHRAVVLSRAAAPPDARGVERVAWTPLDPGPWMRAVDGADAVVHLAGEPVVGRRWTPALKERVLSSRVTSTRLLVEAIGAATRAPRVLVCASGVGYYGAREAADVVDEEGSPGDDFLARVCVDWEAQARAAEAHGTRVVAARIGFVLGRDGGALSEMVLPFKLFAGGPIGSGRQMLSWIHVEDVARMVVYAVEHESVSGPVNVTAGSPVPNVEMARAIGRVLGRPSWLRVPEVALRLRFGEGASPIVTGQAALPGVMSALGFEWRFGELEAALRDCLLPRPG